MSEKKGKHAKLRILAERWAREAEEELEMREEDIEPTVEAFRDALDRQLAGKSAGEMQTA